jgi:hypothetical protein
MRMCVCVCVCVTMTNHVKSRAREFRNPSHKTQYRMLHLRQEPEQIQNRHKCEGCIVPVQLLKHVVGEEILPYSFWASAFDEFWGQPRVSMPFIPDESVLSNSSLCTRREKSTFPRRHEVPDRPARSPVVPTMLFRLLEREWIVQILQTMDSYAQFSSCCVNTHEITWG